MDYEKQINLLKRNIHISKYISTKKIKLITLRIDLIMLHKKYGEELLIYACLEVAKRNAPINNLTGTLIAYIKKKS